MNVHVPTGFIFGKTKHSADFDKIWYRMIYTRICEVKPLFSHVAPNINSTLHKLNKTKPY